MPIRVVFWGNSASSFSAWHFAALLDTPAQLVSVVDVPPAKRDTTNPLPASLPNPVQTARQRGIITFEPDSPNEPDFVKTLAALKPDLFIAAGYALILKRAVLAVPNILAANFHASLLPEYRGKHPVFWALRNGEKWAGLTVHAMDKGIDTGEILYQVKVRTRRDDSVASLYERITIHSVPLVGQLVTDAARDSIPRRSQAERTGSYYSGTTDEDFRLVWHWPAEQICRYITVTPGRCYIEIGGERVYFLDAVCEQAMKTAEAGTLLRVGCTRAAVAASPGAISSSRIKVEGQEEETFANFCRRVGLVPGDLLPSDRFLEDLRS
jgi:methionyl-tRNA formyltransferase